MLQHDIWLQLPHQEVAHYQKTNPKFNYHWKESKGDYPYRIPILTKSLVSMKLTPQGISEMTLPHGITIKTVLWVNDSNLENLKKKQTESDYNRLTRRSPFPCSSHMLLLIHILMLFLNMDTSNFHYFGN